MIRLSTQLDSGSKTISSPKAGLAGIAAAVKQANSVMSALKKKESSQPEEQKAGVPSASSDKLSEEGSTSQDNAEKKKIKNP